MTFEWTFWGTADAAWMVHAIKTAVCAPTPLQVAAVTALNLPQSYYDQMTAD